MERIKQNDTFDVLKVIMAMMITIIHIITLRKLGVIGSFIFPILRTAVPLFFMISSYLFFSKINIIKSYTEQKKYLFKAIKRNLQLYLSWFIILIPITFYVKDYFKSGILKGILLLIWNFLSGDTFIASWFIVALIIGLFIVFYLTRRFSNRIVFICSLLVYILCILTSNYGNLASMSAIRGILTWWLPYNSFTAGLVWIIAGKLFADNRDTFYFGPVRQNWIILLTIYLLYLEQIGILYLGSSYANDCYFMLVPLCFLLFASILRVHLTSNNAKQLRVFSTITYCLHASLAKIPALLLLMLGLPKDTFPMSIIKWIITIIGCVCVTLIVNKIERFKRFKWIKYLH